MFSENFMRFLISYQIEEQKPEEKNTKKVKHFRYNARNRIAATVLLTCNTK